MLLDWREPMADPQTQLSTELQKEFLKLFARHQHQIQSYIVAMVGHWSDADDVMQETSVALWDHFSEFELGTDFRAWACRVAHFRVLRYRQKCGRDRHVFNDELVEQLRCTMEEELPMMDPRRDALEICLKALKPSDRELLENCYARDHKIVEIAKLLRRPAKSLYKALERIRRGLFQCILAKMKQQQLS